MQQGFAPTSGLNAQVLHDLLQRHFVAFVGDRELTFGVVLHALGSDL